MRYPVVLFDLNGVLVDDEDLHEVAFRRALTAASFQFDHDDYSKFFAGRTDRDGFLAFLRSHPNAAVDIESLQKEKAKFYAVSVDDALDVFDDAIELVRYLKELGFKIGLVTGSSSAEVDILINEIGLHGAFDVVVTSDDVKSGKPSAEPFLLAAKTLGVRPGRCVVIEDSPAGLSSAHRAGMRSIAVTTTHSGVELRDADIIVERASEINRDLLLPH